MWCEVSHEPTTNRSLSESTSSEWDFADISVRQTTVLPIKKVMCVVFILLLDVDNNLGHAGRRQS